MNVTLNDQTINELQQLVGPNNVSVDESDLQYFGGDWCRQYSPNASAIVFPRSLEQVQSVVKWSNNRRIALVPSGGRTGLSAGATALNGEVILSMDKLNRVIERDQISGTITVEAGVITAVLQEEAEQMGLYYPVDFASAGSSQIGGNIATNAGGIKVIRYGMTRDWILGLTVVTGAGEILELNRGLLKNNTGYDFRQLFIGSEGTLGVVVNATIKLAPKPLDRTVLVLAVDQMTDIMSILTEFKAKNTLNAFEFFSHNALEANLAHRHLESPLAEAANYYALIELETPTETAIEAALACFEECLLQGWVTDGVLSQSEQQAQDLWILREGISESIAGRMPYKNDLSVSVAKVPEFLAATNDIVACNYPDFEVCWFGHIGDGNLHLNILKPENLAKDDFLAQCKEVSQLIFSKVADLGGSISAEHGVGVLKRDYLHYSRSAEELALMRSVKQVFDPNGIMNPGKIL